MNRRRNLWVGEITLAPLQSVLSAKMADASLLRQSCSLARPRSSAHGLRCQEAEKEEGAVGQSADDWRAWTQFILRPGRPEIYVLIMPTSMFALLAGEAAALRRNDIMLDVPHQPRLNIRKEKEGRKLYILVMPEQAEVLCRYCQVPTQKGAELQKGL